MAVGGSPEQYQDRGEWAHGKPAPELLVRFKCEKCRVQWVLNAYRGVPECPIDKIFLVPQVIVRSAEEARKVYEDVEYYRRETGQGSGADAGGEGDLSAG